MALGPEGNRNGVRRATKDSVSQDSLYADCAETARHSSSGSARQ